MDTTEARTQIRARLQEWHARFERLKAGRKERREQTREAWGEYLKQLQELQATIAEEVQRWNAEIDKYDVDPDQTMQKEFEERYGLPEFLREINAELAASKIKSQDVG